MVLHIPLIIAGGWALGALHSYLTSLPQLVEEIGTLKGIPYGTADAALFYGEVKGLQYPIERCLPVIYLGQNGSYLKTFVELNCDGEGKLCGVGYLHVIDGKTFYEVTFSEDALDAIDPNKPLTAEVFIIRDGTAVSKSVFDIPNHDILRLKTDAPYARAIAWHMLYVARASGALKEGSMKSMVKHVCSHYSFSRRGIDQLERLVIAEKSGSQTDDDFELIHKDLLSSAELFLPNSIRHFVCEMVAQAIMEVDDFKTSAHLALLRKMAKVTLTEQHEVHLLQLAEKLAERLGQNDSTMTKCYTVLGLTPDSSLADIKTAYRNHMKDVHPDKLQALSAAVRTILEAHVKEINHAYDMLLRHKGIK